jgi:hypothetical protein
MADNRPEIAEEAAATERDKAMMLQELYAAFDFASKNAADPVAQSAFRQKFAECREWITHS